VTHLINGLQKIKGLRIYGITEPDRFDRRVPTVSFRMEGISPKQVAEHLGNCGIFVWDGNYYALAVTQRLDVEDKGGMVRVGLVHYNTTEEVKSTPRRTPSAHEVLIHCPVQGAKEMTGSFCLDNRLEVEIRGGV
jgi:selenocysteine lyase/cysteine desulfurase